VTVEVHGPADRARLDLFADGVDGGGPAEGEPDARLQLGRLRGRGHHRLGVGDRARERLLAQDVLPGGEQGFDDRAVQVVGHRHADDVDVGASDRLSWTPPSYPKRRAVSGRTAR
jgi:hypothetical protein